MNTFRWLHLTDLHLGMSGQKHLWPNFEEALLNDLKSLYGRVGAWNLVLFTGDLTQRGTKAEFDAVEKVFQKLWNNFKEWGFTPTLLAIPGNHDLVRPEDSSDPTLVTLLHSWHLPQVQQPFWEKHDSPQRSLISRAFQPFSEWWEHTLIPKHATVKSGLLPGDCSATFEANGFNIGVIGLNSAYLQLGEGNFNRRLHVDVRQVQNVCDDHVGDWTKRHDACILLTHHPVEWLNEDSAKHFNDEIHCPPERFALHLYGHMHESSLTSIAHGGGNERRRSQGCSLFGLENWGEKQASRKHGYSLGELKLECDELRLRIWPRVAIKKDGGGQKLERDASSFELEEDDGGTKAIVVKKMPLKGIGTPRSTSIPPLPPKLSEQYGPNNPPFYVPYRQKGDQVIGREESLSKVRQQLIAGKRTAIGQTAVFQGFGGLGKTQLAVEYAYSFRESYPNGVIWLTADQDIDAQLVDLAVKARWVAPESEHSYKLEIARRRLRSYSECLIIFDNLEQIAAIQSYLPEHPATPHVLATSRTEQPDFTYIPIDVLDPDQSLRLLIQESGRQLETEDERDAAKAIAKRLEGLPLAIELAGAYLSRRPVSWHDYLELLQHNFRKAMPHRLASLTGHTADLYSTLQISQQVFAEEPRLRDILDVLTWSAAAPMGLDLLASLLEVADRTELTGALGLGTALRILQQTPGSDAYGIHRLVHEVRREEILLEENATWATEMCRRIANWFSTLRNNFLQLPRFEAEIEHLREWHEHSLQWAPNQSSRLTWLQAYPAFHRGQPQEIKRLIEIALKEYQQMDCDDRELLAQLYNDLAHSLNSLDNPKYALELGEKALTIQLDLLGEQHPDTARSLNNIAALHDKLGNPKLALELVEQALTIRRGLFGEQHPDTATSLNNNALYHNKLGNPKLALELAEQALTILSELFGDRHPNIATSLLNIAAYHDELGNPKLALGLAEQALTIQRELFGERHPNIVILLSNSAGYHMALGKPKRALELAEQALTIQRELFGEQHRDTAGCLHSVAFILLSLGNTVRSHKLALEASKTRMQLLGSNHPETLSTLALLRKIPGFRAPSAQRTGMGKKRKTK